MEKVTRKPCLPIYMNSACANKTQHVRKQVKAHVVSFFRTYTLQSLSTRTAHGQSIHQSSLGMLSSHSNEDKIFHLPIYPH